MTTDGAKGKLASQRSFAARAPRVSRFSRFWAHLTRTRARNALSITTIAILLYGLTPHIVKFQWFSEPFRQFLLILAGVAAGAVFLPELSGDLWTLTRDEVKGLIPDNKRQHLAQVLISAASDDDEWSSLIYNEALTPLMSASRQPAQFVKNMTYSVQAHLNQSSIIAGRNLNYHSVETLSRSERVLPSVGADGTYWISVARTQAALIAEFANPACLAREVVSLEDDEGNLLTGDQWREVVQTLCKVSVTLNGEVQDLRVEAGMEGEVDVLRWKFRSESAESPVRIPIYIGFDFPIRTAEERFPVYFSGFYCAGATVVSMKVFGLATGADLRCDTFFARGLRTHRPYNEEIAQGLLCKQRSFSTGRDSILWPGSGVVFDWHNCCAGSA